MNKLNNQFEKSRSSFGCISNKRDSRGYDKDSKIHTQIKAVVKKRGVYVEKKSTELSVMANVNAESKTSKHPARPGKKRFLDSVLNILSKSTAGTQYPDSEDTTHSLQTKIKSGKSKNYDSNTNVKVNTKRKPKYKSKILNDNKNFEGDLFVIQSMRNVSDTPSIYSERSRDPETVKWSDFLPPLVRRNDSSVTNMGSSKDKDSARQRRVTLVDNREPLTLVSSEAKKDDKKLYKFFVDVLQTALNESNEQTPSNVHNFKDINETNAKLSNTVFEMDEFLAQKLEMKETASNENINDFNYDCNRFSCTPNDYEINNYDLEKYKRNAFNYKDSHTPINMKKTKRRLKSDSFLYKKKVPIPFTNNLIFRQSASKTKKPIRKEYKRNFLNVLKKELEMNDTIYEEPVNLYQALKVLARQKRCSQKTLSFNDPNKNEDDDGKCIFKRRRVLSARPKLRKRLSQAEPLGHRSVVIHSNDGLPHNFKKISTVREVESTHSILVYGYDYENPKLIRERVKTGNKHNNSSPKSELNDESSVGFNNNAITICSVKDRV